MAKGTWGTGALETRVYDVSVQFRMGLSVAEWGFGLRNTTGSADLSADIRDWVAPWVQSHFRGLLTPEDRLVSLDVANVAEKTGVSFDYGNLPGTGAGGIGPTVPSMLAVVVSMKSGYRQRLGSGRFFLPVRIEGNIDGDLLSGGATTLYQQFVTDFGSEFIGTNPIGGARLANFHDALPERPRTGRNAAGKPPLPAVGATWYDVESLRLNTQITALKSRKAGVGS